MLEDALSGLAPCLPWVQVPADFTAEKVLQIHSEMQRIKLEKVRHLAVSTQGKRFAPEELASAAAMISQAAEEEVLDRRKAEVGTAGEVFHAAIAKLSRSDDFRKRMAALDVEHRKALKAALQTDAAKLDMQQN